MILKMVPYCYSVGLQLFLQEFEQEVIQYCKKCQRDLNEDEDGEIIEIGLCKYHKWKKYMIDKEIKHENLKLNEF